MKSKNKDILKGKELMLAALNRLDNGTIAFFPSERQSSKQKNKIQSIVSQITDKAAGAADLIDFGEESIILSLHSHTRGNVHYAIRNEEDFTEEDVISDLADYLAEKAYLSCARKILNTERLDVWFCDAKIKVV